jgi:hypothetical protein
MIWAWQVHENGEWNLIAAVLPGIDGMSPLVTTREHVAQLMRPIAVGHGSASGLEVRLVHYNNPTIVEIVS